MQWMTEQLLADAGTKHDRLRMGRYKGRRQGRYDDKGIHCAAKLVLNKIMSEKKCV